MINLIAYTAKDLDFHIVSDNPHIRALPKRLKFDQRRYQQVLLNLLSNAVKYSHMGMIQVIPSIVDLGSGNQEFVTAVRDEGIGFSPEDIDKIFKPFELSQKNKERGLSCDSNGIGLSVCKKICNELGGDITLQSTRGIGSTFTFSMKVFPVEEMTSVKRKKKIRTAKP